MTPNDSPPPLPEALARLIARATAVDGSPPFSDGALIDPEREVAWLGPAAALVSPTEAEFVVDPDARAQGHGTRMLEALIGRNDMLFWAHGDHPAARALAASHRLVAVRELLHLEAPVPEAVPEALEGTAPFRTGDADAWLALNARAFAAHPEQGAVTRDDLDALMAEPWFDADDFLLLWHGDDLLGYCWLKVEGGEGEFYVVGVSPDHQGEGLGRELVRAGFARLASLGVPTAHLYVEGDNAAALHLYESFGFTRRAVDIQYLWRA